MDGVIVKDIWEDLAETPEEAANLKARDKLIDDIKELIETSGLTQRQAAIKAGIAQPRLNKLIKGHIDLFTVDALLNIYTALGGRVEIITHSPTSQAA